MAFWAMYNKRTSTKVPPQKRSVLNPQGSSANLHAGLGSGPKRLDARAKLAYCLEKSKIGQVWAVFQFILALASAGIYIAQTYISNTSAETIMSYVDLAIVCIFVIDFVVNFIAARLKLEFILSGWFIIDLVAILPTIIAFAVSSTLSFSFLRVVRLLKVFQALKMFRRTNNLDAYQIELMKLIITLLLLIFVCTGLYQEVESYSGGLNLNFHTALYFMVTTMTTVGYGDIVPTSDLGRVLIICLMLLAVAMIPAQASRLSQAIRRRSPFAGRYTPSNTRPHVLVTGELRTAQVRTFFEQFFHKDYGFEDPIHVVLLDNEDPSESLQALLFENLYYEFVSFLRGSVLSDTDLKRAAAESCVACFILTDPIAADPIAMDAATMLRAISVKKYHRHINIYAQLIRTDHMHHLSTAGIQNVLALQELEASLVAQSLLTPGVSTLLGNVMVTTSSEDGESDSNSSKDDLTPSSKSVPASPTSSDQDADDVRKPTLESLGSISSLNRQWTSEYLDGMGQEIYAFAIPDGFIGRGFRDVVEAVLVAHSCIVFAISRDEEVMVNPSTTKLLGNDMLFALCDDVYQTYDIATDSEETMRAFDTRQSMDLKSRAARAPPTSSIQSTIQEDDDDQNGDEDDLSPQDSLHSIPHPHVPTPTKTTFTDASPPLLPVASLHKKPNPMPSADSDTTDTLLPTAFDEIRGGPALSVSRDSSFAEEEEGEGEASTPGLLDASYLTSASVHYHARHPSKRRSVPFKSATIRDPFVKDFHKFHEHILLIGNPEGLNRIVAFLVQFGVGPICILTPQPILPNTSLYEIVTQYEQCFVMNGNPLQVNDLGQASVLTAGRILVLSTTTSAQRRTQRSQNSNMDDVLVDWDSMTVYLNIKALCRSHKTKMPFTLLDVVMTNNIRFLTSALTKSQVPFRLQPPFSAGFVLSTSIFQSLIVQIFYNPELMSIVTALLSDRHICAIPVPADFTGRPYIDLFKHLLRERHLIALGLYLHDGAVSYHAPVFQASPSTTTTAQALDRYRSRQNIITPRSSLQSFPSTGSGAVFRYPYVRTNPAIHKRLGADDVIFVIGSSHVPDAAMTGTLDFANWRSLYGTVLTEIQRLKERPASQRTFLSSS